MSYDIESKIEKKFRKKIQEMGGKCYKWVSPGNDGVPDRIVILPGGRIIFVELKTDKGRLSEIQKYQQDILADLGCDVTTLFGEAGVDVFLREVRANGV